MNPYSTYDDNNFNISDSKPEPAINILKQVTIDYGSHQYDVIDDDCMITIKYKEQHEGGHIVCVTICELYKEKAKIVFAEALKLMGGI